LQWLIGQPQDAGYVKGLAYLLLGAYGLGVSRAWELLGAQNEGLFILLGFRRKQESANRLTSSGGSNKPAMDTRDE